MRSGVVISALLLLSALTFSSTGQQDRRRSAPAAPSASPAPTPTLAELPPIVLNASLKDVEGGSFSLSTYSGKVLVVTLWATWCAPCRTQVNALTELHQEYSALGVEVVGLTTENPDETTEAVRDFVKEYSLPFKNGWSTGEVSLILMQGRDSIPQTYVVSHTGRIVRRFIGFAPDKTQSQIRSAIDEALAEKSKLPE
jgi:peroxiredoxin